VSSASPTLLALDTSSEGCSAALYHQGDVSERFEIAPRGHTRLLMPMVRALLAERQLVPGDLDAIGFARGPGSFTGLRIATGVVQGLAWGLDVPVLAVSSLAAVAARVLGAMTDAEGQAVAVAFDARMGEVYWGCFQQQGRALVALAPERGCAPGALTLPDMPGVSWTGAGSGWKLLEQMPAGVSEPMQSMQPGVLPHAREVVLLALEDFRCGKHCSVLDARPVYLRDEVTWQKLPGR